MTYEQAADGLGAFTPSPGVVALGATRAGVAQMVKEPLERSSRSW